MFNQVILPGVSRSLRLVLTRLIWTEYDYHSIDGKPLYKKMIDGKPLYKKMIDRKPLYKKKYTRVHNN